MATFDKTKRPKRYNGGTIRRTTSGGHVGEIYQDRRLHRSPTCESEQGARAWIDARVKARDLHGALVSKLTGKQVADAVEAIGLLQTQHRDETLTEAVQFFLRYNQRTSGAWTVSECLTHFLNHMEHPQDGSSPHRPRSVKTKKSRLKTFVELHGPNKITEISKEDVDKWLAATGATGRNLRNYRGEIQTLFNYVARHMPGEYQNTVARFQTFRAKERPPAEIVEPRHVGAVLLWLETRNPRVAVGMAIGCFAGLRTAELVGGGGLQWSDIDFEERLIVVPASLAKTRDRREVLITDNLMSWLVRHRARKGRVTVADKKFRDWRSKACEAVGVTWPSNGARHSFGTYYAKLHGYRDAADQLGHIGSIAMLKAHYSGKCTKEQATEYFSIIPVEPGKVIEMKQTKT